MRLVDLEPEWLYEYKTGGRMLRAEDIHGVVHATTSPDDQLENLPKLDIAHAQGVLFLCPVCFKKNGGSVGTESVICWFRDCGVPDNALPGPGRWVASGTGLDDLTLSPSVNVDHEHWHGFVQNGEIVGGI